MKMEIISRRLMRRVCSLVTIACLSTFSLLLVGCSGKSSNISLDGQTTSTTSPNDKAPAPSAGGQASVTCKDIFGKIDGDQPGNKGDFPADFPEPPPGSTLCGTVGANIGGHTVYLNTTMSDEEILKYYQDRLGAQGYKLDKIERGSGGDQRLDFERPGTANGWIKVSGDKDPMATKYRDVLRVSYHALK